MAMFVNLGRTLSLLRELRGKSQARVAREAGIGKSQLSKYENGKELPKLDSLEKVLNALKVGYFEFFYTLYLVDRRAADLARAEAGEEESAAEEGGEREGEIPAITADEPAEGPLYMPPLHNNGNTLLADTTDQAFSQVFTDLLLLYRRVFEQMVLPPGQPGTKRPRLKAPG
ncbi:MAG TPA: helix-turn-helix transcriptional regulator [Thermoanaerobaculia bacterium]|jgi:transcriptional regulator with XRE-family HTH domain|nr:helix-turn-helix transcriptional regulator [Thermoanaerobaculia bacterium]